MIKVITGIRRCGKSCIMQLIMKELEESGVPSKDLLYIDLDKKANLLVSSSSQLEELIDSMIQDKDFKYLFIDEIQNVKGFEQLLNAYNTDGNISIFITRSNSYLLSGDLVTKLTGRYLEFEIYTLDFSEFIEMKKLLGLPINSDKNEEFQDYLINGGFPKSLEFEDIQARKFYTKSIINEIFEKDIKKNQKIRNTFAFEKIQNYLINNFGATFSIRTLVDYFTKVEKYPIKAETISRYIKILTDAKILYECSRFDCKSKKSLIGEKKYYLADLSIYFMTVTDNRINYRPALENLVYLFLKQNSYSVSIGKIGNFECDFIARKLNNYSYIQVSMSIANKETEEREYRPFYLIKDNYPKYLLTLDFLLQQRDGIIHKNLIKTLLEDEL